MNIPIVVDTAVIVPLNACPLIDDTDFKTIEASVVYNAAGLTLVWNFVTPSGVVTQTAVTPTTAGVYDWQNKGNGMYAIEIPASGGASINNDTEGVGYFTGVATGVLPWRGPNILFAPAHVVNGLVTGSDNLQVDTVQVTGTAQTARDIGASVLLSSGTGTGQVKLSSGYVAPNWGDVGNQGSQVNLSDTILDTVNTASNVAAVGTNAITAGSIGADAIGASELAADAVTEIQNGLATSANQTTILARLGSFAGSGLNTVFGFLRALGAKAAALTPSDLSSGTTYDNTTDSQEAIRDNQSAGSGGGSVIE